MADSRHVENRYDVITPPQMVQFEYNLVDWSVAGHEFSFGEL